MEALRRYNPNNDNEGGGLFGGVGQMQQQQQQQPGQQRPLRNDELVAAASLVVAAVEQNNQDEEDESHTSDYEEDSTSCSEGDDDGDNNLAGLMNGNNNTQSTTATVTTTAIGHGNVGDCSGQPQQQQAQAQQSKLSPTTLNTPSSRFLWKQYDAGRMSLGKSERRYALKIKAAVEETPDLDDLSDFMYAQLAIVGLQESRSLSEDLPAVLERIESLQQLRQELFVRDTLDHGMEMMTRVLRLLPSWFLAMSFLPDKGCYLRVVNLTNFDMSIFTDPIKVRTWLAAVYYINHCHVPDLEAARRGFVQFVECKGYDWRSQSMFHIKAFSEAAPSFALYPILCKQTVHYHTSMFVRLLASMARRMLPKHMTEGFEFEGDCEFGETLEAVFCEPNVEESSQRLLVKLRETLQQRYQNEQTFVLK